MKDLAVVFWLLGLSRDGGWLLLQGSMGLCTLGQAVSVHASTRAVLQVLVLLPLAAYFAP